MNIFAQESIYVTITEAKESSEILSKINDESKRVYITKAQTIIDNIIWKYGNKEDITQKTIFPVIGEWIPLEIKQATILLAENLSSYTESDRVVTSEKRRWNAVTYEVKANQYQKYHPCMNADIFALIKKFIQPSNTFYRT